MIAAGSTIETNASWVGSVTTTTGVHTVEDGTMAISIVGRDCENKVVGRREGPRHLENKEMSLKLE